MTREKRPRLVEIIRNLAERISEALTNGSLGEAQGLQVSLDAAKAKLTAVDQTVAKASSARRLLGLPRYFGSF